MGGLEGSFTIASYETTSIRGSACSLLARSRTPDPHSFLDKKRPSPAAQQQAAPRAHPWESAANQQLSRGDGTLPRWQVSRPAQRRLWDLRIGLSPVNSGSRYREGQVERLSGHTSCTQSAPDLLLRTCLQPDWQEALRQHQLADGSHRKRQRQFRKRSRCIRVQQWQTEGIGLHPLTSVSAPSATQDLPRSRRVTDSRTGNRDSF